MNWNPLKFRQKNVMGRKTSREKHRQIKIQSRNQKKQRADRQPVKSKNHNEFFRDFHGFAPTSAESPIEISENDETIAVSKEPSESNQKSTRILEKNDSIETMRDDIRELKQIAYGFQRQLARVEVLIKFQKESDVGSNDGNSQEESYIGTLQLLGLPITS